MDPHIANPDVSVVMSVYNGAHFLQDAIESILGQTFKAFEFIIINDGSTDETAAILARYTDPRIRVVTQPNKGLVASLNRGIRLARGRFIARQDADDISDTSRLQKQYDFLTANPGYVLVGSSMRVIDAAGKPLHAHAVLVGNTELKHELLVRSPFAHGSVMFEKQAAASAGLYRKQYWPAEDYDLWLRMAATGQFANIDEFLYGYREHESGISAQNAHQQSKVALQIQEEAWLGRRQLIGQSKIRLGYYKQKEFGTMRIERILGNIARVSRRATADKDISFAVRNAALVAWSPLAYRKVAGSLKRRMKKQ